MAMETLSSTELLDFIIYDTISALPHNYNVSSDTTSNLQHNAHLAAAAAANCPYSSSSSMNLSIKPETTSEEQRSLAVQGRTKRRRRPKVCKNKEEAETQRMTHITVERNRRKQMNEHLAVLRSLMPDSYVQRGDQASIVGGAIDFVKELEHILQSLEAKKFLQLQECGEKLDPVEASPFSQFFTFPQFITAQTANKHYTCSKTNGAIADIEVTLVETHANIRILLRRRFRQLSKLIGGFQAVYMTILHLNVTTLEPMVLYSISTKMEEGCPMKSADDIGGATHQILRIIEEEEEEEEVVAGLPYAENLPPSL
ncbi:transcription factor bHLH71-like [Heracleum sosnowskyi]|uniref:Transcription factor bHLH71-like n=1 Tax=Heracleum sosnowskyi TaxID=360622 RepID=A0AAD8HJ15_9APIA|nr:transcription factor bHLH71-like [Heracleum sosnowskyi]